MTIVIKRSDDKHILLPGWLMNRLQLQEGELEPQLKKLSAHQDNDIAKYLLEFILSQETISNRTHLNGLPSFDSLSQRIPGLHADTIWISDDFDDPLPDEFWLGEADETFT